MLLESIVRFFRIKSPAGFMKGKLIAVFIVLVASCTSVHKTAEIGDFHTIIERYSSTLEKNDPEINYMVAEAYRKSNRNHESEPFYKAAIDKGVVEQDSYLHYAQALKADQRYELARKVLTGSIDKVRNSEIKKMMERELENLGSVDHLQDKDTYFRAKNLETLNTPDAEYSPVYLNNYLYFVSNRHGGKVYKTTGTAFTDIYRVRTKGANVDIRTLRPLDPVINHDDVNEGTVTFSADGSSMIFAKANDGKANGHNDVHLYFTRFRNGKWLEPRPISINSAEHWDSTPSLSPDGKTLYFSSDRPGGFGKTDLYVAKLNRRGRWVDVRNLGPDVNTSGNEQFPFISESGDIYFASDGHPGLGKLDIFKATRTGGRTIVENLGTPMNSHSDDFGYYEYNITKGFFTSNRKGGKGDDDIYTFINDDPDLKIVNYFLAGTTVTEDDGGKKINVSNTTVKLLGEEDEVIDEVFADENGNFQFRVYAEEKYDVVAEKTDYFTTRTEFSTVGKSIRKDTLTEFITNVNFETEVKLDRIVLEKAIALSNIYYDLAKWDIRADAADRLDSLVMIMEDNPDIYIELGSHTDDRAGDDFNLDLSFKRARSAVQYIISQGVSKDRIVAKGYGESQLLIANAETEEDHQKNRRTEFKVLKYNPRDRSGDLPPEEELDEYDRFFSDTGGR